MKNTRNGIAGSIIVILIFLSPARGLRCLECHSMNKEGHDDPACVAGNVEPTYCGIVPEGVCVKYVVKSRPSRINQIGYIGVSRYCSSVDMQLVTFRNNTPETWKCVSGVPFDPKEDSITCVCKTDGCNTAAPSAFPSEAVYIFLLNSLVQFCSF